MKTRILAVVLTMMLALGLCGVVAADEAITIQMEAPTEPEMGMTLTGNTTWAPGSSPIDLNTIYTSGLYNLENTGDVEIDVSISGTDATEIGGGTDTWMLDPFYGNGIDKFGLAHQKDGVPIETAISGAAKDFVTNFAPEADVDFRLLLRTPTDITNWGDTMEATVVLTMVASTW